MPATRNLTLVAIALVSVLLFPVKSPAQENADGCEVGSPYSPARTPSSAIIAGCDEIIREIEKATDAFFDAECKLLEARRRALDTRSYGIVNHLIQIAAIEFKQAGDGFTAAAEGLDPEIPIPKAEHIEAAAQILEIYGYETPETFSSAFEILGKVSYQAASELGELEFGTEGNEGFVLDSMYDLTGSMVAPGGVFRAIASLIGPQSS